MLVSRNSVETAVHVAVDKLAVVHVGVQIQTKTKTVSFAKKSCLLIVLLK